MPDLPFVSGLEAVVAAETVLSEVDGDAGRLTIRGHRLEDIAGRRSFEWVLGCLWAGFVNRPLDEASLHGDLGAARAAAFPEVKALLSRTLARSPTQALRAMIAAIPDGAAADLPVRLTATIAVGLCAATRLAKGDHPIAPDPGLGHAADLLRMLRGAPAEKAEVAALETYLVTACDHGLNASTFAARVVASTRAGLVPAVTAALCALEGPLHGGAPGPVLDMLDATEADGGPAERWIEAALSRGERLMGFGHRVYRVRDPRAEVLKPVVADLGRDAGRIAFAEDVEQAALTALARRSPKRPLQTNTEFYTALLLEALGVPREAFTGLFAAARVGGWVAHALEQAATGRLIRPQSRYVGPSPCASF
jgi:citrate synthase